VALRARLTIHLLVAAAPLAAQSQPLAIGDRLRETTIGMSWYSPAAASLGSVGDRRVYLTGVRVERVFLDAGRFALAYAPELVPLAVVERTRGDIERCRRNPNLVTFRCEYDTSAGVAIGAGVSPVGMKLYWNQGGRVRVYGSGNGGALLFQSDVPVHNSRRANLTFEFGGGVEMLRSSGAGISVGYKFHHISNAATRTINPGLDSNVLFVGLISRVRHGNEEVRASRLGLSDGRATR
jgi:hypothetical protein